MPPAPRPFASFKAGERCELIRKVDAADVDEFARLSGDDNLIHLDDAFAARTRFKSRVVHGALTFGFMAAAQTQLVGPGVIWLDSHVRFTGPVRIGDTVVTTTHLVEVDAERRILRVRTSARVWNGPVVMEGESTLKCLRELEP